MSRVGQSHIYTVCTRLFWQGNHWICSHTQCIQPVLANPTYMPLLHICHCHICHPASLNSCILNWSAQVDLVISPISSSLLGVGPVAYPLVCGDINLVKLLQALKPKVSAQQQVMLCAQLAGADGVRVCACVSVCLCVCVFNCHHALCWSVVIGGVGLLIQDRYGWLNQCSRWWLAWLFISRCSIVIWRASPACE